MFSAAGGGSVAAVRVDGVDGIEASQFALHQFRANQRKGAERR